MGFPVKEVYGPIAAAESGYAEEHVHNQEYWFGKRAPQIATQWADRASLAVYSAISGADAFGTNPVMRPRSSALLIPR